MPSRFALAGVLLVVLATTAQAQRMLSYYTPLPTRSALERVGLERAWFAAVPLERGDERIINISLADDTIYVQSNRGYFHAFDAESGRLRWSVVLGRPSLFATDASVNETTVFVSNANVLYALDRATGRGIWSQGLESFATSSTAADEETAIIGTRDGKLVAYSLTPSEHVDFRAQVGAPGGFAWNWQTLDRITSKPILTRHVVAFGSNGGNLYVARRDPPELLHRSQRFGAIEADLGTYGTRTVLVPSTDNNLYAVDLFTGEQLWVFPTSAPIRQEPLTSDENIYILNEAGLVFAVDPQSGESIWSLADHPTGAQKILAIGENRLYLLTQYGDLIIVDRATGDLVADGRATFERARLNLRDYNVIMTNDHNDRIYMATPSGSLICLREIGAREPHPLRSPTGPPFGAIPGRDPEATPTPPEAPPAVPDLDFDEEFNSLGFRRF